MSKIQIKIVGTNFKLFDNFNFSTQINTISSSISFESFIDIESFGYVHVEAYKDGDLIFTGEIINKELPIDTPPKPFIYKAESLTHRLDSNLPLEAFPLELENSTLRDVVEYICSYFDIVVVFDESAENEANNTFKRSDISIDKSAAETLNSLVTNTGLILTHSSAGELVVTKKIEQDQVLLPMYLANGKSYNLKGFFYNYIALGQAPIDDDSNIQSIAKFTNIDNRRTKIKIQDSGDINTIENKALGMRSDSLKSISQTLDFNNFFCNIGDFVIISDYKLVINSLNYTNNSKGEKASISLIDAQIYER